MDTNTMSLPRRSRRLLASPALAVCALAAWAIPAGATGYSFEPASGQPVRSGGIAVDQGAASATIVPTAIARTRAARGAKRAEARPGRYEGAVFNEGDQPNDKEWVRFRVDRNGRVVKKFTSRLWVICYVGPPTYNINLPVKFTAPRARIDGGGRVDHSWTEDFAVDDEVETLSGHLKLRFRGGRVEGKVSLEFARCGTTTGDPPGYMRIQAKRVN